MNINEPSSTKVVILQHAGDYREAFQRLKAGGSETYYAQRYSVESVGQLVAKGYAVTFITAHTDTSYDEVQENGVRAIGAGYKNGVGSVALEQLVSGHKPDRLIFHTLSRPVMQWAKAHSIRSLAVLADSFNAGGLRDRIRNWRTASLLNHDCFEWIGNHGLNSCLSLRSIGVRPDKLVPWDWPAMVTPREQARSLKDQPGHVALFVGMICEEKGIGDVLRALALLKSAGMQVRLRAVGKGAVEDYLALARSLGVEDRVEFVGLLPHAEVMNEMKEADVVIVPSRHEYPEGLPMTIYETLCSRTPLVVSDHPMFRANLQHEVDALVFPAGNSEALSKELGRLLSDSALYQHLSAASAEAWSRLQLPVKWGELVSRWLGDSAEDRQWLVDHRLVSGRYPLERYR